MVTKRFGRFLPLLLLLSLCRFASAHPMGNFSVNHYSKISLDADRIRVRYFIDLAEIPTYQELQQANIAATAIDPSSAEVIRYIAARGVELGHGLMLDLDGKPVSLHLISSGVIFPPGAGGLPTMKMGFVYDAPYPSRSTTEDTALLQHVSLHYADDNYPGHTGWKEIIALASAGTLLHSSVSSNDRSEELSNYPTDLLTSPPQALEASVVAELPVSPVAAAEARSHSAAERLSRQVEMDGENLSPSLSRAKAGVGGVPKPTPTAPLTKPQEAVRPASIASATMHLQANRQQTPRSRFTELIQAQDLSVWFLFTAAIIAIGLGGLHALEPGHGKTIVAAYLVGSRGNCATRRPVRNYRYRISYGWRIRAWSDHVVRVALHRARATLSMARRTFGNHNCGARLLYAFTPLERNSHGSYTCSGRIAWQLDVLEACRRRKATGQCASEQHGFGPVR